MIGQNLRETTDETMDPIYSAEAKALERTISKYGDIFIEALEVFSLHMRAAFNEQKDEENDR